MKKMTLWNFQIWAYLFLLNSSSLFSQSITPSNMSSITQTSSQVEQKKYLDNSRLQVKDSPSSSLPLIPTAPTSKINQSATYLHPGILVLTNGKWEGSDHLLNLTNQIGVSISIVKPEDEIIDVTQEQLQKQIEAIFNQRHIKPQILTASGQPPLPVFEMEIFIYPIDKGYAACCEGRLFESVKLDRFKMDSNMAFQAITWEKQTLLVGPKTTFTEQLIQNVHAIATAFVERYQNYERIKGEIAR